MNANNRLLFFLPSPGIFYLLPRTTSPRGLVALLRHTAAGTEATGGYRRVPSHARTRLGGAASTRGQQGDPQQPTLAPVSLDDVRQNVLLNSFHFAVVFHPPIRYFSPCFRYLLPP